MVLNVRLVLWLTMGALTAPISPLVLVRLSEPAVRENPPASVIAPEPPAFNESKPAAVTAPIMSMLPFPPVFSVKAPTVAALRSTESFSLMKAAPVVETIRTAVSVNTS